MPSLHSSGGHWVEIRKQEAARAARKQLRRDAEFARARKAKGWGEA